MERFPTHQLGGFVVSWWFVAGTLGLSLLTLSLFGVAVLLVTLRIQDAVRLTREERDRSADERDAFDEFSRRVARIETSSHEATDLGASHTPVLEPSTSSRTMEEVRELYEETVMAVPHYQEEYDDSVPESMAMELGEDLAVAVLENNQLTSPVKMELVTQARVARDSREKFIETLEDERDSLTPARQELAAITGELSSETDRIETQSVESPDGTLARLDGLEDRCDHLLSERQTQIHDRNMEFAVPSVEFETLQAYLYSPLDTIYPVLADVADIYDRIQDARHSLFAHLDR